MKNGDYFIDDRVIIPDEIKKMTHEERLAEIARLEKIAIAEKEQIIQSRKVKGAV